MKIFTLLVTLALLNSAYLQTNVSGAVSGVWTMAGSPYNVIGNIGINGNQSLEIQAGVQVVFQGFYGLAVTGELKAQGTLANPVVFKMQDTTGWYNDQSSIGGWRGIRFNSFSGNFVDSTNLTHCIIKDVKHGVNGLANGFATVYIYYRNLTIDNCEFTHNQSRANQSNGKIIDANMQGSQKLYLKNCNIHDNRARVSIAYVYGIADIENNEMHDNIGGCTFFSIFGYLNFLNNNIHHNSHNNDLAAVRIDGGVSLVKNNIIHHNTSDRMGAIMCTMGKTTIESNLICNNNTMNGSCGITDGGGGLHLSHNNNGVWDSTEYIVRNNVIANNHCAFYGGGLYIYDCKVKLMNNHFINNSAQLGGGAFYNIGASSQIQAKNNLFYGNDNATTHTSSQIQILTCNVFNFDKNWIQEPMANFIIFNTPVTSLGDTTHNHLGINPNLVNPSTQLGLNDDALLFDFNLSTSSIDCINKGDSVGAFLSATDYLGNARFVGSSVDIGAFENNDPISNLENTKADDFAIYPNPCEFGFKVRTPDFTPYQLAIYNLNGALLSSQTCENNHFISTTNFVDGIYLIEISSNFNRYLEKLIIKNH
jgi:hypothetical protein